MAEHTHYLDAMIREATVTRDLHARLVLAAHYRIAAGDALAVSWPDWKATPGEFGLLIRVFGPEAALTVYRDTVQPFAAAGLVRLFPVQRIPETKSRVVFARDRGPDKLSPSVAARLTRRAAARGNVWQAPERAAERTPHFLMLPSESGQRMFPLYIARTLNGSEQQGGKAYGLGLSVPEF